jgi:hypothetical protein
VKSEPAQPKVEPLPADTSTTILVSSPKKTDTKVLQIQASLTETAYKAQYLYQEGDQTDTIDVEIPRLSAPLFRSDSTIAVKNGCVQAAPASELDKVRVAMIAAATDAEKIAAVKPLWKKYCVEVKQIRALSELFPSDAQKLIFFGAAYPYTFDPENYSQLIQTLTEPGSIQAFQQRYQ